MDIFDKNIVPLWSAEATTVSFFFNYWFAWEIQRKEKFQKGYGESFSLFILGEP